jgi:hypothetical protein
MDGSGWTHRCAGGARLAIFGVERDAALSEQVVGFLDACLLVAGRIADPDHLLPG